MLDEPPPFGVPALEALDWWELMGCRLRMEAVPVLMAMHPETDPNVVVGLLKVINSVIANRR